MDDLSDKIAESRDIYNEALDKHEPTWEIALFSGGHDSLVSTHFAMEYMNADFVLHLDTGVGIPQTQEYVKETCEEFGWELKIYSAMDYEKVDGTPSPQDYVELVKEHGFPGPQFHWKMYQRLKERPLLHCLRDHKEYRYAHTCQLLCTGRYKRESQRRMRLENEDYRKKKGRLWCSPMFYWHTEHFQEYRERYVLPLNPVAKKLCMSGECMCGAFAGEGDFDEMKALYPDFAEYLEAIEREVKKAGHDWGWEEKPPQHENVQSSEERQEDDVEMDLCAHCLEKHEERKELENSDTVCHKQD